MAESRYDFERLTPIDNMELDVYDDAEYNEKEGKAAYDFLEYVHQLSKKDVCVR